MLTLDVGCGWACHPGAVGVDRYRASAARVVADARRLPFRTGSVEAIHCANVLEHFRRPERVLAEAHRVLVPGGRLHITVPHFSSPAAHGCPEHRWVPGLQALRRWAVFPPPAGWRGRLYGWRDHVTADMGPRPWRLVSRRLTFHPLWRRLGIERLANIYPELWEAFAAYWIGVTQHRGCAGSPTQGGDDVNTVPRCTRLRYRRETLTARRAVVRASSRANQAATWCMLCYAVVLFGIIAAYRCGQKADEIERHVLTVAGLLQRQTEILLERVPVVSPRPPRPEPLDLPAAIAEGA